MGSNKLTAEQALEYLLAANKHPYCSMRGENV